MLCKSKVDLREATSDDKYGEIIRTKQKTQEMPTVTLINLNQATYVTFRQEAFCDRPQID